MRYGNIVPYNAFKANQSRRYICEQKMMGIALTAAAAAVLTVPVLAQHTAKTVPAADREFMIKAAQGGMGEVTLGSSRGRAEPEERNSLGCIWSKTIPKPMPN